MRKIRILVLFVVALLFSLSACDFSNFIGEFNGASEEKTFTVFFDGNGGMLISGSERQEVKSAEYIIEPEYEYDGYRFDGWDIDIDEITEDSLVKAKWIKLGNLVVSFDSEGGTAINEQYLNGVGLATKPKDPIKENNIFCGWFLDDEEWDFERFKVTNNITLKAKWINCSELEYSLSYDDNLKVGNNYKLNVEIKDVNGNIVDGVWEKISKSFKVSNNNITIDENGEISIISSGKSDVTISYMIGDQVVEKQITINIKNIINLNGYTIKLAQADYYLGNYDVWLNNSEMYGEYERDDKNAKKRAWREVEREFNCVIEVDAYPSDAPWGPSRWSYIINKAMNKNSNYDFYVISDMALPELIKNGALMDLTDYYDNLTYDWLSEFNANAFTYYDKLYAISDDKTEINNMLGYNVNLWEKINIIDPTIKEPAQMFLDGEWNYDSFREYCNKVQNILDAFFSTDDDKYYCLSGYGTYYWIGLTNAGGITIIDKNNLKCNLDGNIETAAANTLKDIFSLGAMDPAFQVDQGVATWNAGRALFNTGDLWFVNAYNRWCVDLWGTDGDTKYGYVPFPNSWENEGEIKIGTYPSSCIGMAAGREWAYEGYGSDCTAENIFYAISEFLQRSKDYYEGENGYSYEQKLREKGSELFGSEASIEAYVKVMKNIDEYAFYEPIATNSNAIISNYAGNFASSIKNYIKGTGEAQWFDAVYLYIDIINETIKNVYKK